jgi:endonuclease/exonuclease/phosphatase family metal-dependent hydrolase
MNINNKFHIDYCFISKDFNLMKVNIGTLEEWENTKLSEHCPLIVELEKIQ